MYYDEDVHHELVGQLEVFNQLRRAKVAKIRALEKEIDNAACKLACHVAKHPGWELKTPVSFQHYGEMTLSFNYQYTIGAVPHEDN